MKNIVKKMLNKINLMLFRLGFMLKNFFSVTRKKLAESTGAFGEQGTWVVVVVVIAGIILLLLRNYITDDLFPRISKFVDEFFSRT